MKVLSCVLLFFLFFYFTESMVKLANKNKLIRINHTNHIRREKNNINELTSQIRKTFNRSIDKEKDALFGDVIKNITRVNNVLEELIKNYEKLKYVYKSSETTHQEQPEADTTDLENDGNSKQRKSRAKETNVVIVTRDPNKPTDMFIFDEKVEVELAAKAKKEEMYNKEGTKLDDKKEKQKKMHDVEEKRAPIVEFLKQSPKEMLRSATSTISTQDALSIENENMSSETTSESNESDINDNQIRDKPTKTKGIDFAEDFKQSNTLFDSGHNDSRIVKTVIKAEEYFPNFWEKLAHKEPVHLRTEKEITHGKEAIKYNYNHLNGISPKKEDKTETAAVHAKASNKFKSIHVKTGVKLEKGSVKTTKANMIKLPTDLMQWSMENDKTIEKEQFKTSILRKAYGDACLKVVVKKCYKACKQVPKTGCVKYDCKQEFINAFKEHSKTGCLAEFRDETVIHKEARAKLDDKGDDYDFVDITRSGYLASACLPPKSRPKTNPIVLRTTGNVTVPPTQGHQLNILRDRFELACQKASAEKCKRACYYATSQVCTTYDCKVGKKSNLARECRVHCKEAYHYAENGNSDGSDTDTDTDIGTDASSSAPENVYNESQPDPDFETYLNTTTMPSSMINKPVLKKGVEFGNFIKVSKKKSKGSNVKVFKKSL